MSRRSARAKWFVIGIALLAASCGDDHTESGTRLSTSEGYLTLSEIGIEAELGVREQDDRLALLRQPLDVAFVGNEVFVLDASEPWIRVFDRQGVFLRSMVRAGKGPREATWVSSVAATNDGGWLLNHGLGVTHFDREGNVVRFLGRESDYVGKGAVEACGQVIILAQGLGSEPPPRFLASIGPDGHLRDTLVVLGSHRPNSRRHHTWFVAVHDDGIVFYPEETEQNRLVEFVCAGGVRGFELDSLGPGTIYELVPEGFRLYLPQPPFPAGVGMIGSRVFWAANVVLGSDSVTVVTVYDTGGRTRRALVEGWFQILASDSDRMLALGNSFGYNRTWGLYPSVVLVNGESLVRSIDARARRP